jgi:hypothetical protein
MNHRHTAPCPEPDCDATLRIPDEAPPGEYDCICNACRVRVGWATHLNLGRKPYVTLVKNSETETDP